MTLSAHEQSIFNNIEAQLTAEDPRLSRVLGRNPYRHQTARLLVLGLLSVVPGLSLLIFALTIQTVPLGIVALLALSAGAYIFNFHSILTGLRPGRETS